MRILSALYLARVPATAFFVLGTFWGAFAASVPDIKGGLGVNDFVFGLLLLGNPIGLVTAMWLAPRIDAWLADRALQAVTAAFACCFVIPGLAPTPTAFACGIVLLGITSGLTDVIMNARVSELEAKHKRTLMNVSHGLFSVGYAVSALITGFLRDAGQPPVIALAMAAVCGLVLVSYLRTEISAQEDDAADSSGMPWGIVILCGLIVLAAFLTEGTVETWSALHVERTLGGDPLAGSLGPVMLGVTMAIGRIGGQGLSDRFDDGTVIIWATLMTSIGALIAASAPTPLWAYVGFGTLGLGVSVIGPLGLAVVGRMVPARHRTEAIAKVAVMGFSGFFIAPVLMGGISELYSLRVSYTVVGIGVLTTIYLVIKLRQRTG